MTDSTRTYGPELLDRVLSTPDPRDYKLETFTSTDPLDVALAAVLKSSASRTTKTFDQEVVNAIHTLQGNPTPVPPSPTPTPTPVPTSTDIVLNDPDQLDQGQTGHCVGFGVAQFCNLDPINDHFTNADGHAFYYECKVIDGEPKQENGSQVRSGLKVLVNHGRIKTYASVSTVAQISQWLQTNKSSVVIGSDWMNDMFNPDANGFIVPTGGVAGGHCYVIMGDIPSEKAFEIQNSWGNGWGLNGRAKIKYSDFAKLLANGGEAWVAIELPLGGA